MGVGLGVIGLYIIVIRIGWVQSSMFLAVGDVQFNVFGCW